MTAPIVTVLIPARNEAADIERCIAAVRAQDYPLELLEIIVVDGASSDGTAERAARALAEIPFARTKILTNAVATTPSNLNLGMTIAQGEILCRVDARSCIPPAYVRTCVEVLTRRPDVSVVGGAQVAVAAGDDPAAQGIARALNNRWAMGLSRYRRRAASGPSDTVYLGAFRTPELRREQGWSEELLTNQDFELNRRLGRQGVVWFDASLEVAYVPRPDVRSLFRQYRRFGTWKVRYWRATGDRPRPRQLVMAGGVPAAALGTLVLARPWRHPVVTGIALGGIALGVDAAGGAGPASLPTRVAAVRATAAVALGWLTGVWSELLRPAKDRST